MPSEWKNQPVPIPFCSDLVHYSGWEACSPDQRPCCSSRGPAGLQPLPPAPAITPRTQDAWKVDLPVPYLIFGQFCDWSTFFYQIWLFKKKEGIEVKTGLFCNVHCTVGTGTGVVRNAKNYFLKFFRDNLKLKFRYWQFYTLKSNK